MDRETEKIMKEIESLRKSPYVKLAKKVQNQALKQRLYTLRSLEKKGKELAKTMEIEVE